MVTVAYPLADTSRLIESRPEYRQGRPYIAGTGVSVGRIGVLLNEGFTPAEIAYEMSLTELQVYAALTCYFANKAAIDADLIAQDEETDRVAREHYAAGHGARCSCGSTSTTT